MVFLVLGSADGIPGATAGRGGEYCGGVSATPRAEASFWVCGSQVTLLTLGVGGGGGLRSAFPGFNVAEAWEGGAGSGLVQ